MGGGIASAGAAATAMPMSILVVDSILFQWVAKYMNSR